MYAITCLRDYREISHKMLAVMQKLFGKLSLRRKPRSSVSFDFCMLWHIVC